ncbi:formate dehydrogenase subunit gamma [Telmatospirillum sp. J64-1]|uniref:formate dehydrogenase subunit gamma n=1 Tax=Telmatospirillum sp. J64-1 TaxID=2502183 RepID=UPI00115DEFA5|nr:formate dehydrogenase subunit gamma [Telmatospirillum sp. J64-1]
MRRHSHFFLLAPLLVALALLFAMPAAQAQYANEPRPDAPTAPDQVQIYNPDESRLVGSVTIPDQNLAVLVQPEGRDWRSFRRDYLPWIIGGLAIIVAVALLAFFLIRGKIRLHSGLSGRKVLRFNSIDRFAHWTIATSFLVLALTGLILTFGRPLLLPLIGNSAFTALAQAGMAIHNFFSIPFVVGLVLVVALWIKDNIPNRSDVAWVKTMGGMLSKDGGPHVKTGRFNAGQKGMFWSIVLGGLGLAVTGFLLMTPFAFTGIWGMQVIHIIHGVLAALLIAAIIGHIYIGTVGMEGAFDAMGNGQVDENWAREHHAAWYEEQVRKGYADSPPNMAQRPAGE